MTPIAATAGDFDDVVARAAPLTLVDFWAAWCGPCRAMEPVLHDLAEDYAGEVSIVKVDVEAERELATRFDVRALPTLLLLRGGVEERRIVGQHSRTQLAILLDQAL